MYDVPTREDVAKVVITAVDGYTSPDAGARARVRGEEEVVPREKDAPRKRRAPKSA